MSHLPAQQYDSTQLNVSIGIAARLQASTITEGGALRVALPGTNNTVDLPVLAIGKIDPDIIGPSGPVGQDRPPMPGMLLDMSPLLGDSAPGNVNAMAITFDANSTIPAVTQAALNQYNVNQGQQQEYLARFGGQSILRLNMKLTYEGAAPEVLPANSGEFASVGMDAAAAQARLTEQTNRIAVAPAPLATTPLS